MAERSVQQAIAEGVRALKGCGIEGAARDARLLMAAALVIAPDRVTLHAQDQIAPADEERFLFLVRQRQSRRPVAQIVGGRWFHGHWFKVTPDTLDPRPETEALVEQALAVPFDTVLDLGTGTGCILLSLLCARPDATGVGVDISSSALSVAQENAVALDVGDRTKFDMSRWYEAVSGKFDLIVANPPYVTVNEMEELAPELSFEPRMALTDEGDGLSAYGAILAGAGAYLRPGGWLMVEIGSKQGEAVRDMFSQVGFEQVQIVTDLDGRDRVVNGLWTS